MEETNEPHVRPWHRDPRLIIVVALVSVILCVGQALYAALHGTEQFVNVMFGAIAVWAVIGLCGAIRELLEWRRDRQR